MGWCHPLLTPLTMLYIYKSQIWSKMEYCCAAIFGLKIPGHHLALLIEFKRAYATLWVMTPPIAETFPTDKTRQATSYSNLATFQVVLTSYIPSSHPQKLWSLQLEPVLLRTQGWINWFVFLFSFHFLFFSLYFLLIFFFSFSLSFFLFFSLHFLLFFLSSLFFFRYFSFFISPLLVRTE